MAALLFRLLVDMLVSSISVVGATALPWSWLVDEVRELQELIELALILDIDGPSVDKKEFRCLRAAYNALRSI